MRGSTVGIRWLAVLVAPLLAAVIAQVVTTVLLGRPIIFILGEDLWLAFSRHVFSLVWAVRSMSAFFMGGAFVLIARWAAPSRRATVATIALCIIVLWGARFVFGAFAGSRFFPWLVVMGAMGWLGGAAVYFVSPRRGRPTALGAQHVEPTKSSKDHTSGGPASHAVAEVGIPV